MALLPEVACVPLQPPEAVQLVAFVELHCRVVCPPLTTLVGLAPKVSVGAGVGVGVGVGGAVTVTATDLLTDPPLPEQASTNVVLVVKAPEDWVPDVASEPLHPPLAVHEVAFVVLQVRLTAEPDTTLLALAARVSVGAGGGVVVPPVP